MTRKYSKFVALVAGTITAVVAAWKMAGWERVPGYLSLGDVAYLWTAVDERNALSGVLDPGWEVFGNEPAVGSTGMYDYVSQPWTNRVVLAPLQSGNGLRLAVGQLITAVSNNNVWAVPGIIKMNATQVATNAIISHIGAITNLPVLGYSVYSGPSTSFLATCSDFFPRLKYVLRPYPYGAYATNFTYIENVGTCNYNSNSISQAYSEAVSDMTHAETNVYTEANIIQGWGAAWGQEHTTNIWHYYSAEVRWHVHTWPSGDIGVSLLDFMPFYAKGSSNCIVSRAWLILEDRFVVSYYGAQSQAGIVGWGLPKAEGYLGSKAGVDSTLYSTRYCRAVELTPSSPGDQLYPRWSMPTPSLPDPPTSVGPYFTPPEEGWSVEWYTNVSGLLVEGDFETYKSTDGVWDDCLYYDPQP